MTGISVLHVPLSLAGAGRVLNLLEEAAAEGRDLGSRVPHMQLHARALDVLSQNLDTSLQAFRTCPEAVDPEYRASLAKLDRLVYEVRKLVELSDALLNDAG